ncbi:IclR family transcriptional regulator [Reichenbachiella sp. 5M10]|uniref:uracil-DNA glycosylase family protein n=1 Tax=Reichenbachiella sp. 5M10 TaxID=1889772 RepID=UPI000C15BA4D|nr:uracil-DNA glycosylase family protein [Reichenbachiella sp. 5M10]PIB36797.1 IclR family transcriptional regulator [Reichenbachiella sp. 5M10]
MDALLSDIKNCTLCEPHLPTGVRPVLSAHSQSKIVIIGQAPGRAVHQSGIPWDDQSGDNLRQWLGIDKTIFYDPEQIALIPMGFCYPGTGESGDLPPRKECAPLWHDVIWKEMTNVKTTLLIGQYAQRYYLGQEVKKSLTETVKNYQEYMPKYFVLPHPSPRNNIWRAKNPWFDQQVLPVLREKIHQIM